MFVLLKKDFPKYIFQNDVKMIFTNSLVWFSNRHNTSRAGDKYFADAEICTEIVG